MIAGRDGMMSMGVGAAAVGSEERSDERPAAEAAERAAAPGPEVVAKPARRKFNGGIQAQDPGGDRPVLGGRRGCARGQPQSDGFLLGSSIAELVRLVADDLHSGALVALGFECPLFVPLARVRRRADKRASRGRESSVECRGRVCRPGRWSDAGSVDPQGSPTNPRRRSAEVSAMGPDAGGWSGPLPVGGVRVGGRQGGQT